MFVFSVKTDRKSLVWGLTGVIAVLAAVVVMVSQPAGSRATGGKAIDLCVSTAEERVQLLNDLGHQVSDETVQEIRLPDDPDEELTAYEALQQSAGMSLLRYAGKRVKLYTYTVTNAQTAGKVTAHLYVYRNRVIAGDITPAEAEKPQEPLINRQE